MINKYMQIMSYNEKGEPSVDLRIMLEIIEDEHQRDVMNIVYNVLQNSHLSLSNTECAIIGMNIAKYEFPNDNIIPKNFPLNPEHFESFIIHEATDYIKHRKCNK